MVGSFICDKVTTYIMIGFMEIVYEGEDKITCVIATMGGKYRQWAPGMAEIESRM